LRYKLYHIPFWLGYHLVWLTINIGSLSEVSGYLLYSDSSVKFYFYVVFQILGVYFNLYYLIPKLLHGGRYIAYIASVLATTLACTALISSGYYVAAYLSDRTFYELFGLSTNQFWKIYLVMALPSTAAAMTLAMSIKLGKNWLETEKRQHRLEKEKLEAELKYLKSQINPHFLFNTINSIFALIPRNPDLASESLATFSDMLRYQLYECNDETIALSKEVEFISNFIDLEQLRLNTRHTHMQFDIRNHTSNGQTIAPFILIPFIENAFKHVSKGKGQKNFITMDLSTDDAGLRLYLSNSTENKERKPEELTQNGGIGLKNVQRRLNLIYNERYRLHLETKDHTFSVNLEIVWQHR